jgi:hypothetical protein
VINPSRISIEQMAAVMVLKDCGHNFTSLAEEAGMSAQLLRSYYKQAQDKGFQAWKGYLI